MAKTLTKTRLKEIIKEEKMKMNEGSFPMSGMKKEVAQIASRVYSDFISDFNDYTGQGDLDNDEEKELWKHAKKALKKEIGS